MARKCKLFHVKFGESPPVGGREGAMSRSRACLLAFFAGFAALICAPAIGAEKPAATASVRPGAPHQPVPIVIGLQLQDRPPQPRLLIEFSDPVPFRTFLLTNPSRIVIDLPEVFWRPAAMPALLGQGIVKNYRFGLFRKDNSRLVLELNRPAKVVSATMLPPKDGAGFRLSIELSPETTAEFAAHSGWPRSEFTPRPNEGQKVITATDVHPLIILDPGHGGMDPGTHGESGLVEKDIALSVARHLRDRLLQSGRYRVKLTRDADVFIPLRDRVAIARSAHGDLFVSLHVDSNEHREIRGASVYTLSPGASDRETANLAEKENLSGAALGLEPAESKAVADSILMDLGQREIMNLSARFAETIVATLPEATTVHAPLPHRSADFAVLKAPDIPSVLVELGYLTNHDDESQIMTEAWRSRVAAAIAGAIDRHFSQAPALERGRTEAANVPLSGHIGGVRTGATQPPPVQEFVQ
jgi:N-acetylmuramoyl-L-alanine amidase